MYIVEVYPFKNNKEKFQLMKKLDKVQRNSIEILINCIVVEKSQFSRG